MKLTIPTFPTHITPKPKTRDDIMNLTCTKEEEHIKFDHASVSLSL